MPEQMTWADRAASINTMMDELVSHKNAIAAQLEGPVGSINVRRYIALDRAWSCIEPLGGL